MMKGLKRLTWTFAVVVLAVLSSVAPLEAQSVEYREVSACPTVRVDCPSKVIVAEPLMFEATDKQ